MEQSQTNPCRNGILFVIDELASELKMGDFEYHLVRDRLHSALTKSSEAQAIYFIKKIHTLFGDIICSVEVKKSP